MKNGIVKRSVTHTEYYAEPISPEVGEDSDPVAVKLPDQPWFWIGVIAVGLSFAQQLGISIDFGTHAKGGDQGTTIINNKN